MGIYRQETDPIALLRSDHETILETIENLRKSTSHIDQSRGTGSKNFAEATKSGMELLDLIMSHMRKEEEILYPELEALVGGEGVPIPVMRQDHDAISMKCSSLSKELESAKIGEVRSIDAELRALEDDLRGHFSKEQKVLFWLAELHLTDNRKHALFTRLVKLGKK